MGDIAHVALSALGYILLSYFVRSCGALLTGLGLRLKEDESTLGDRLLSIGVILYIIAGVLFITAVYRLISLSY